VDQERGDDAGEMLGGLAMDGQHHHLEADRLGPLRPGVAVSGDARAQRRACGGWIGGQHDRAGGVADAKPDHRRHHPGRRLLIGHHHDQVQDRRSGVRHPLLGDP
jgi:hypothetical protein